MPPATATAGQTSIGGTPVTAVAVNYNYAFTPTASGAPGRTLAFSIQGKPDWATFNALSGALTGVPRTAGVFANIVISASDGITSAKLPSFSVTVASGTGATTLSWTEPTQNEDKSALTDLVGYRVYFGTAMNDLANKVNIASPEMTNYAISGLIRGATYYFSITAVNSRGEESALSNIASQVI